MIPALGLILCAHPLSWYSHRWVAWGLFGSAAIVGISLAQFLADRMIAKGKNEYDSIGPLSMERNCWKCLMVHYFLSFPLVFVFSFSLLSVGLYDFFR